MAGAFVYILKIINGAGGNITVESELGKGTKIIIHFKTEPEAVDI